MAVIHSRVSNLVLQEYLPLFIFFPTTCVGTIVISPPNADQEHSLSRQKRFSKKYLATFKFIQFGTKVFIG